MISPTMPSGRATMSSYVAGRRDLRAGPCAMLLLYLIVLRPASLQMQPVTACYITRVAHTTSLQVLLVHGMRRAPHYGGRYAQRADHPPARRVHRERHP